MGAALIDFDELRHDERWRSWRTLAADAPPFLGPEFFALARPLVPRGEPLVAGAWVDGRMTGALPLVLDGKTLRALVGDHSPGFDFCGTRDGIRAIWECLRDDDRWSELVLDKVPRESLLVTLLPELARADGRPSLIRASTRHPYFALADFESHLKPKFRANLKRCERKGGDVVLERLAVPVPPELDEANAIEAKAWKAAAGTDIKSDPHAVHMYRALARLLGRRGRASLTFLRVAGRRIASLFALEDGRTLYALKIGYDPAYANISPGHLLIWKVAQDAERRGLVELDFVGHEDEWKRKWTDEAHDQVLVTIYQRSARGIVRYALREMIKPRLPQTVRETPTSPLPRRCQRADVVGTHTTMQRVRGRLDQGLGIKSGLLRALRPQPAPVPGAPSAFAPGSWVRVRDDAAIRASLDARDKTRGLAFVPSQWKTCGGVFQVASHVRRIRDDHGRFRTVHRTVLLAGVDCSFGGNGEPTGCGRHCPLMFRDEWLEAAAAPHASPPGATTVRHARVREVEDIMHGLDLFGRRDGVTFMPEMAAYSGRRFPISGTLEDVFEYDRWTKPPRPLVLLGGAHCTGAICRGDTCDRACTLMWHPDWLIFE